MADLGSARRAGNETPQFSSADGIRSDVEPRQWQLRHSRIVAPPRRAAATKAYRKPIGPSLFRNFTAGL
jgi:hypothetical protein